MLCLHFLWCTTLNEVGGFSTWIKKIKKLKKTPKTPDVLLDGLQDRLPVFCSLESDLFPDDVSVLPLHLGARFRLGLDAQKLVLVPQVHLMFYCGCGRKGGHFRPGRIHTWSERLRWCRY